MFEKVLSFKEVAIFYILLALILFLVAEHNKQIDVHIQGTNYYIIES